MGKKQVAVDLQDFMKDSCPYSALISWTLQVVGLDIIYLSESMMAGTNPIKPLILCIFRPSNKNIYIYICKPETSSFN